MIGVLRAHKLPQNPGAHVPRLRSAAGTGKCAGFRATQRIPNFEGELTGDIALEGKLEEGTLQRLASLCSKHVLSAEVVFRLPEGEEAEVVFEDGCATSLKIVGVAQTKLVSPFRSSPRLDLAELSTWSTGRYEVRLRPLFGALGDQEEALLYFPEQ